jgi:hypothetical protein
VTVVDNNCVTVTSFGSCAGVGEMNNANKHATNQISFIDLSLVRGDDPAFSSKKGLPIRRTRIQSPQGGEQQRNLTSPTRRR